MRNTDGVLYEHEPLQVHERMGSPLTIRGVRVARIFSFLFYVVVFNCYLCPVSCVRNVTSVFGLFIHFCPFAFL